MSVTKTNDMTASKLLISLFLKSKGIDTVDYKIIYFIDSCFLITTQSENNTKKMAIIRIIYHVHQSPSDHLSNEQLDLRELTLETCPDTQVHDMHLLTIHSSMPLKPI